MPIKNKNQNKVAKQSHSMKTEWDLNLLYKSENDQKIEQDVSKIENALRGFAEKYDTKEKAYLTDEDDLRDALVEFELLIEEVSECKPIRYFYLLKDIDSKNTEAPKKISLYTNRIVAADNQIKFFEISIGKIDKQTQEKFLKSEKLKHYRVYLERCFDDAKHSLSVAEEKIMSLKDLPSHEMWIMANDKLLNSQSIKFKGKTISMEQAKKELEDAKSQVERKKIHSLINAELAKVAPMSEAEINAVYTDKKINDDLRGFKTPYELTVRSYRNEPEVVETMRKVVSDNFDIAKRFYKIKAKLLKLNKMYYFDRSVPLGNIKKRFTFNESVEILKEVFGKLNPIYSKTIEDYLKNGQIDVFPKIGKEGGAYCAGSYREPSFVLLNHTDKNRSFATLAHELGHAFHTVLSRKQSPLYFNYSYATAETASTLFEFIAADYIYEGLSEKEKIVFLHDRISDSVSTIFRQIACFNFELDIHTGIRSKGFVSKEEIMELHNKNMQAYLGPIFKMEKEDGYMFTYWSHLRRHFYVYSYAYGLLVSMAMRRKFKQDPGFWNKIEKFLSAGGKDSPENILEEIGINVRKEEFWLEGIKEIENDIIKLEKLAKKL